MRKVSAARARLASTVLTLLLHPSLTLFAADTLYRSVSVDKDGQLHIILESGKEILPRKTSGQVSFYAPLISADSRTIGWLVLCPHPEPVHTDYQAAPVPLGLVIYRTNHAIHTFATGQVFWDWQFQDGGRRVAYSTGPTHGGATTCVLRDVASGRIVATWLVTSGNERPSWAQNLRR